MANLGFDASTVDPSSVFDPLPAGKYACVITESGINPTKAGTGHYLKLAFRVIEGEYTNRMIFENLNIDNPNAQAKEIALKSLSAICHATGVIKVEDSSALHGIPLMVAVKIVKDQNDDNVNSVKGYAAVGGATSGAAPRSTPPAGSPASAPRAAPAATPPASWSAPAAQAPAAEQAQAAPVAQAPAAPVAPVAQAQAETAPEAPLAATGSEATTKAPWM